LPSFGTIMPISGGSAMPRSKEIIISGL
jgi:hypothetical protein